jgi:hypothetical protein
MCLHGIVLNKLSTGTLHLPSASPLLLLLLTNFTDQTPSREANDCSNSQDISKILWNLKVFYPVHDTPPPFSALSQMNPLHNDNNGAATEERYFRRGPCLDYKQGKLAGAVS